jgi:undecaprenyl-phosphate 4-deoxy-4-formamido-L-arabinose transferase
MERQSRPDRGAVDSREQAGGGAGAARPAFSVVVPVYNSASILPHLAERLAKTFAGMRQSFELLLVDDGSRDGSWAVVRDLQASHPEIRAWRLMRNFGQHNALMCGFQRCRGDFVVTLDDDLQNPPEEIPRLFAELQAGGWDVVFGYFEERRHSRLRNLASRLSRRLVRVAIPGLHPRFSNFRLLTRRVVDEIAKQTHDYLYTDGLISWVTTHASAVDVRHDPRFAGESNYTFLGLVRYFLVALLTFTAVPLRFISLAGIVSSAGALAVGAVYLALKLAGRITEPGFAAIIVSVVFLGGVQLFSIGIVAEYIGKMFMKQSHKPQYVVREGGD